VAARSGEGRLHAVYAADWELGNGASLGAAEHVLLGAGSFLLVAADHMFGDGALLSLLSAPAPACLIDRSPSAEAWDEGTRVRVRDGRAVAFGKALDERAIDCGAFLLTPEVFDAHRDAATAGDASLAGALNVLAARQPLTVVPLPDGCWWHDIDTPEDLRVTKARLRRSLVKRSDGPVSRYVNRPISTRMSMVLAPLRPSPDLLSVVVALLGLIAAWLLAGGHGLAGGLLAQAVSVLDGVDGELARLQIRASPRGALLDGVLDRIVDVALVAALGVWAVHEGTAASSAVALVAAAAAGSVLSMATKDRIAALRLPEAPERAIGYVLGGRDGRIFLIALFAVSERPAFGLAATAIASWLAVALRVVAVRRRTAVGSRDPADH